MRENEASTHSYWIEKVLGKIVVGDKYRENWPTDDGNIHTIGMFLILGQGQCHFSPCVFCLVIIIMQINKIVRNSQLQGRFTIVF